MTRVNEQYPLPTDSAERKEMPITRGVLDYFPQAIAYISRISFLGNEKHNGPDSELHWARGKSMDQHDCVARHLIERGTFDPDDGALHDGKLAWRALAALELELERRADAGEPIWDEETIAGNRQAQRGPSDGAIYAAVSKRNAHRIIPRFVEGAPTYTPGPVTATDEETGAQLVLDGIFR